MCSFCWTKLYSSVCIVLGGLIKLGFVFLNWVYGCGVSMCLLGGFRIVANLSSRDVVQSWFGSCLSCWLYIANDKLIMVLSVGRMFGVG